jgi:RNA polymerase sigma factor (TIGR02999 family)
MCIRFLEGPNAFKNRRYFFAAASRAMRRLLVESARSRRAKKRGGHWQRVDFSYAEQIGFEHPSELLDLDSALKRLQAFHPLWSNVTELRIFGRLSARDAARILGIGESTARRHFALARKWLRHDMAQASQDVGRRQLGPF